jgi:hypothetical protein
VGLIRRLYMQLAPTIVVLMLLFFPILCGVSVAMRWPHAKGEFYATASGIIATLFIAMAVEFFAGDRQVLADELDRFMVLGLIILSWSGLFGCIRAMLDVGTWLTSGLAGAGLMAASVLVSLALLTRVTQSNARPPVSIVLIFLIPPVALLVLV